MNEKERLSEPPPKIGPTARPPAMRLEWTEEVTGLKCLLVVGLSENGLVMWIDFKAPFDNSDPVAVAKAAYRFGVRQKGEPT